MFTTRPDLSGTFGMVASTHWIASQAGMSVLERGGNAFDAAVAAGFVLQVVEPHLNGPGGEAPILTWDARAERAGVICGQGVAPAAASIDAVTGQGLLLIPGTGLLPACVPGAFGGWMLLLQRYGTMRVADVLDYAIGYAEHGFPILSRVSDTVGTVAEMFAEHWPSSAALWLPDGRPPAPDTLFRNPTMAATYARIVAEAEAAGSDRDAQIDAAVRSFYSGFVAEAIDEFCATSEVMDVSGSAHGGLLRGSDMAAWRATEEDPLHLDYTAQGRTYRVFKAGPWSQAPVFLQQLALLSGCDLDGMGTGSPDFVHTVVEASKLAFADREAFYGDPEFVDVPIADLLSTAYNDDRRALIGQRADCGPLRPGRPGGREPALPDLAALIGQHAVDASVGEPTVRPETPLAASESGPAVSERGETRGDTCHVDVVDRWGNMVSATPSGGWLQSSPTIARLGFCLGTRAQMFWLQPGLANSLAPGKRPRTTLSPTLALRDGRQYMAFGTPGGDQQDQWSLQLFLRHVHHGQSLQQAIDAAAWQSDHFTSSFYPRESFPGRLRVEGRMHPDTVAALRDRGHEVIVGDDWSLGRLSAVTREPDGHLHSGANPRGMQGYAVGR
jgi:gamma-glutamyltranspeptidase/glutathione hydrolase